MKGKDLWKSKTVWVAILTFIVGGLAALDAQNPELKLAGVVAMIKAIIDFILRLQTDQPVRV